MSVARFVLVAERPDDGRNVDGAGDLDGKRVLLAEVTELEPAQEHRVRASHALTAQRRGRVPLDLLEYGLERSRWKLVEERDVRP